MKFEFLSGKKKEPESEVVHDQEKAREMANVEDEYRTLALALKEYMKDPAAFRATEADKVARVAADGGFTTDDSNDYMELYQAGIRPRDLEQLGEKMAEYYAKGYDFNQDIKNQPSLILRAKIAWFKLQQRYFQEAYDNAVNNIDFSAEEHKSFIVIHLLDQLGVGEEHASTAKKIHQWMNQSEEMQRMAESELERRRNGAEGIAA